ncbi:MAG: hypothetical protein ACI8PB_004618 [Desulforhopalus sp.]|jgi:hypothetical protein
MFNTHNTYMAVGGGLIIASILIMSYSLLVSVPVFIIGAYFAFVKAPRANLGNAGAITKVTNSPSVSRKSPCPCGSGKKYKNCCLSS